MVVAAELFFVELLALDELVEVSLGLLLPPPGELAGADVLQVLEPLEVRDGDSAAVEDHVGDVDDALLFADLFAPDRGGSVGALGHDSALEVLGVELVDRPFYCRWDQHVALELQELLWVGNLKLFSMGIVLKRLVLFFPLDNVFNIKSFGTINCRVPFDDSSNNTTVLFQELGCPRSYGTESLDNECFSFNAFRKFGFGSEVVVVEHLSDSVVHSKSSRFVSTVDTSVTQELASNAAFSVDVSVTVDTRVGVLHPGHRLLVRAHVGSGHIDGRANEAFLCQLQCVSSGRTLDLATRVVTRVEPDATLGTAERDVSRRQLVSHESGQSFNLGDGYIVSISCATLHRQLVVRMLGSVASQNFE
mmetsp:Transcript_19408/g.22611  ORF Transcript_19408/g.22611 Transcript_19408/m.22611 type:complete len:362 (+) Transcript_19408:230-1315(+)